MGSTGQQKRGNLVVWAISAIIGLYLLSSLWGLPALATGMVVDALHHHAAMDGSSAVSEHGAHSAAAPPYWTVIPFVLLLGAIAVFPLMSATEHWWENNINRFKVAAGLGLITLCYYAFLHHSPVESHWPAHQTVAVADSAVQTGFVGAILGNAILGEYVPFIVLLFSLYTIAGGIRIEGDSAGQPAYQRFVHGRRRLAGQFHRHHRRGDALDSSPVGDEQRTQSTSATR